MPLLPMIPTTGRPAARHGVELHAAESEGAVAEVETDVAGRDWCCGSNRLPEADVRQPYGPGSVRQPAHGY
jgi:hypothetical protein